MKLPLSSLLEYKHAFSCKQRAIKKNWSWLVYGICKHTQKDKIELQLYRANIALFEYLKSMFSSKTN